MFKHFLTLLVYILPCISLSAQSGHLIIYKDSVIGHISPLIYGSGMEDVNHEVYGGIYDQRIFGESFEEGPIVESITHFTSYGDSWRQADGGVYTYAGTSSKLIYDKSATDISSIETSFRYDGLTGEAGILTHVNQISDKHFTGYAFVVSAWSRKFIIRKHEGDSVREIHVQPLYFEPTAEWNSLKLLFQNNTVHIFFNGKTIYSYTDDSILPPGKTGILSQKADVVFRTFCINGINIPFQFQDNGISGMWDAFGNGCTYRHDHSCSHTGQYSQYFEHHGNSEGGISNMSLNRWGINVKKGKTMFGSLFLKGSASYVYISLQDPDGTETFCRCKLSGINTDWKEFSFKLTPRKSHSKARFVISTDIESKLWADQVTLMSKEQFKRQPFRKDIAQELINEGLTFLRYGGSMVNSPEYMVGHMLGRRQDRQPYRGSWYRNETNGFGIIEFVQLAEAIGATPSFAINIEEQPEDAAHLIEYLNGSTDTPWGSRRKADGHPLPYNVKYVEIGNEEVIQQSTEEGYRHYTERFKILTDAMLRVDPHLQFISSAWWRENSPYMEATFKAIQDRVAYWDYHPWVDDATFKNPRKIQGMLERMQHKFKQWVPDTKTRCAIFEENGSSHGIRRMLGHIIAQNAVRRNADFVLTTCQANALEPYQQNDNGWNQGQVFFTPSQVWHQPTSYAEQLSARHHQPLCVKCTASLSALDVTATRDNRGKTIVLHIANTSDILQNITTNLTYRSIKVWSISGQWDDDNTPENPRKVIPQVQHQDKGAPIALRPRSYTVVELKL